MKANFTGQVLSICISAKKGEPKRPVLAARVETNFGVVGDAHAGRGQRQVSILANESAEQIRAKGVGVTAGDFGENILTEGINPRDISVGDILRIGQVWLTVTQIGKTCHNNHCAIFDAVGICVMPTDGIFCTVKKGGAIAPGDMVVLEPGGADTLPKLKPAG